MGDDFDDKHEKFNQQVKLFYLSICLVVLGIIIFAVYQGVVWFRLKNWCESWKGEIFYTDLITGKFELIDCIDDPAIIKDYHSYTRAICDGSYCIDILIECNAEKIINIRPVTELIDFGEGWEDPKPRELINRWC
jgi:hypothetical protein